MAEDHVRLAVLHPQGSVEASPFRRRGGLVRYRLERAVWFFRAEYPRAHLEVLAGKAPIVAEMFEGRHEVRLRSVHPWEFVDENNLTLAVIFLFKDLFQHIESLLPTGRDMLITIQAIRPHGIIKLLKL